MILRCSFLIAYHPKTDVVDALPLRIVDRSAGVGEGGAVAPGAAAGDVAAVAFRGRGPLGDVALHVVESPAVRRERADRRGCNMTVVVSGVANDVAAKDGRRQDPRAEVGRDVRFQPARRAGR